MSTFSITGTAADTGGSRASRSLSVTTAPTGTGTIVNGSDIRANTKLVGCQLPASALTLHSGDYAAKAGEVVAGLHITGRYMAAANSSITNSKIDQNLDTYPADPNGCVATYCDIGVLGTNSGSGSPGLEYGGATLRYCHVAGFSDGAFCNNGTTILDGCWMHGLRQTESTSEHNDIIQMSNGSNTHVTRCWLDRDDHFGQVSCGGIYKADNGKITGVELGHCLLTNSGGSSGIQALIWHSGAGGGCSGGNFHDNLVQEFAFSIVFNSDQPSTSYTDTNNQWWNPTVGANGAMTFAGGNARQKTG